ncbi:MAG: polyprenyl synthetase family protein [Anaerolineales bacterium]|nr:polyprenyl synthetase family protein [Anaerolineales bacterium]
MTQETLRDFSTRWLPAIESEMRAMLSGDEPALAAYYGMMQYHMGWLNQTFQADHAAAGKRLRPLLCLLACAETGGDPAQALPAAAAIEILHNFSLVHDDIEDGDETRRHRATVWVLWGEPQAINVGDGMFALAFASMQRMTGHKVADATVLRALQIFTETCVALTEGQYLDMSFEQRGDVTVPEYMRMIQGKTAALVGASVAIGALVGGATPAQDASLQRFGQAIGLAFQIQDDILGIWGDPAVTGKAAGNDILRKKKSLPLLHALNDAQVGAQFGALMAGDIGPAQVTQAFNLLDKAGSRAYADGPERAA